jgi:hypothetical protein
MEKLAKYYLRVEGVIMVGIFLSGFYDPSFLLFGVMFVGTIMSSVGAIISWIWYKKRLASGGLIKKPYAFAVGNAVFFVCIILFVLTIFGGGIGFLM